MKYISENEKYGFPLIFSAAFYYEDAVKQGMINPDDYKGHEYQYELDFFQQAEDDFREAASSLMRKGSSWVVSLNRTYGNLPDYIIGDEVIIQPRKTGKRGLYGLTPERPETEEELEDVLESDREEVYEFIRDLLVSSSCWRLYHDDGWGGVIELPPQDYKRFYWWK